MIKLVSSFFEFQFEDIKAALEEAEVEFQTKPRQFGFDLYVDDRVHDAASSLVWDVEQYQVFCGNHESKIRQLVKSYSRFTNSK
ncbi:hypothetical protein ACE1CD_15500 [Aerosakkonema sp. BLCC-F183]|uniref:hypothetical protein n=1 Tax=Aerosakkonema sp. BLCC-F183 TaxID=3342834 RepID=UPI0035BB3C52